MKKTRVNKVDRGIYDTLLHLAPNHLEDAERYYETLSANSALRKIAKEQLSPSFMKHEASLHNTKTNNDAELTLTLVLFLVLSLTLSLTNQNPNLIPIPDPIHTPLTLT